MRISDWSSDVCSSDLQLFAKDLEARIEAINATREEVVGDDRRNRRDQAHGGRDQRFGNAGRNSGQRRLLDVTDRDEGAHDAPDGAEQTDVGAGRTDRRQKRQTTIEQLDLDRKSTRLNSSH